MEIETRFKTKRVRSRRHLDWVKSLPCSVPGCKGSPVDPHHIKIGPEGGGTVRASDRWVVPLGRFCHHDAAAFDGVHRTGNEAAWWARHSIDPVSLAECLWAKSPASKKKTK